MSPYSMVAKSVLREIAGRVFSIRKRTWLMLAAVMAAVFTFLVWAAFSAFGWLFGVARDGVSGAPEIVRGVTEQVEKSFPGADQVLEKLRTVAQAPSPQDVSGTDPLMVTRFPGLARTQWHRDGQEVIVNYSGPADYRLVLEHYIKGFGSQGYAQTLLSATPDEERHEYRKGEELVRFSIARTERSDVKVSLVSRMP